MMFQNEKTPQYTEQFSRSMQRRMEMMLQNADQLFSLGWLRKRLWKQLSMNINDVAASEYGNYSYILRGSYDNCFIEEFLHAYRQSLPDIKKRIEYAFEDTNPLEELLVEREELIRDFARMHLSRAWEYVKDDDQSWRIFARRMPLNDPKQKDDVAHFFATLDHICVITDIVCGHAMEYGLKVDYSCMQDHIKESHQAKMNDEVLARAIESVSYHLSSQSAWAVVYCVLRDDYGYMNQRQFERDVLTLPFSKTMKECPDGTVSKTLSNNSYMQRSVDHWPADKKFSKFAHALRTAIDKESTK